MDDGPCLGICFAVDVVCCYHLMMYRNGFDPLLPRAGSTFFNYAYE